MINYSIDDYLDALPSILDREIIPNSSHDSGRSYRTNCPCHSDRNPSFSISEGRTRVVYYCFAGFSQNELTNYFRSALEK